MAPEKGFLLRAATTVFFAGLFALAVVMVVLVFETSALFGAVLVWLFVSASLFTVGTWSPSRDSVHKLIRRKLLRGPRSKFRYWIVRVRLTVRAILWRLT